MLAELGLQGSRVDELQRLPYADLLRASRRGLAEGKPRRAEPQRACVCHAPPGFGPVADGVVLPALPFAPDAPSVSAAVPMIIGTTLNEFTTGINHPEYELMSDSELLDKVEARHPGRGRAWWPHSSGARPTSRPFDIWSRVVSAPVRHAAIEQARAKAALGPSARLPVLVYMADTHSGWAPRAFHCAEIPFVFDNVIVAKT